MLFVVHFKTECLLSKNSFNIGPVEVLGLIAVYRMESLIFRFLRNNSMLTNKDRLCEATIYPDVGQAR